MRTSSNTNDPSDTETRFGALSDLVSRLRSIGTDTRHVEAKAAAGGLPKSIKESISAFSNSPGGGLIVLGLDEKNGLSIASGFDANAVADAAVDMVRDRLKNERPGRACQADCVRPLVN